MFDITLSDTRGCLVMNNADWKFTEDGELDTSDSSTATLVRLLQEHGEQEPCFFRWEPYHKVYVANMERDRGFMDDEGRPTFGWSLSFCPDVHIPAFNQAAKTAGLNARWDWWPVL